MPQVPLVSSPVYGSAPSANVRADPNMGAPLAAAKQSLAGAVGSFGELAAKVKHANDTAYVIGAQTKLETAGRDFQTWTATNPDTETWQAEWESRQQKVLDDVQTGGSKLSSMAKLHLQTETQAWQMRSTSEVAHLQTQQSIKNAIGIAENGLFTATANNDEAGARAIIDVGTKQGLWSSSHAANLTKRVTLGIATNEANSDALTDPFTAGEKLMAKDDSGEFVNYHGLTPAARATMQFRANKLASETRSQTMREWSQSIADAQATGAPMPDREGINQEAARQGISPKWVERAFKTPGKLDEHDYAQAHNEIAKLDLVNDPDGSHMARAVAIATQYKGYAATQLEKIIKERSDPDHPINASPIFKEADQLNQFNFTHGVYGKYETHFQDPKTGEHKTVLNQTVLRQAQATQAKVRDALMHFIQTNPKATHEDVTKFLTSTYRNQATKAGADLFKFNP